MEKLRLLSLVLKYLCSQPYYEFRLCFSGVPRGTTREGPSFANEETTVRKEHVKKQERQDEAE